MKPDKLIGDNVIDDVELREQRDRLKNQLGNLLARAHRDGGHYQAAHGTEKACKDADMAIAKAHADVDSLTEAVKEAAELIRVYRTDFDADYMTDRAAKDWLRKHAPEKLK